MAEDTQALTQQPKAFTLPPPPELGGINTQVGGVQGVPFSLPTDYAAERKKFKSPADVSAREAQLLQRQDQLNREIGAAEQASKQYLADAKASTATQMREQSQQIEAGLDETRKKFPYPEFHPTKDNIQDIATLFSVIGMIGIAMGGNGKQSAMMSLNAMSGMMKGWQQGRADLWKKEKEEFDKNMQRTKALLEDAYRDADRAYKALAYNRDEANALAEQSAAKLGGQVGKQILERQGIEQYFKFIDGVKKDLYTQEERAFQRSKFAAEQKQRERQFNLQERRLALQESKAQSGGGDIPKDAKTKEEYRARYEIIKNIEDIQSLLTDPKYSKLITPATQFTPQLINNLRQNYPELSQKLARIQAIEFQIGGKALTKTEQEILSPIYGWRGLTADALKSRLAGVKDQFEETNALTEDFYPGLKKIHERFDQTYAKLGRVPQVSGEGGGGSESADIPSAAKAAFGSYEPDKYEYGYENGRLYRDKK